MTNPTDGSIPGGSQDRSTEPGRVSAGWAVLIAAALFVGAALFLPRGQQTAPPGGVGTQGPTTTRAAAQPQATQPAAAKHVQRDADGRLHWPHPRSSERQRERDRMVDTQIASGAFRDTVEDQRVLASMRAVPRHAFVPLRNRWSAYDDSPLPIGHGQTISQPYIVALMTELLDVQEGDQILEIGTGSGYQAAVLSELTPYVYSIEIVEPLYVNARDVFKALGYKTVQVRHGDGYDGWPEAAPFDGIIVTCAAGHVPPPLWEQLKPGGRMVIPVGGVYDVQRLLVLTKQADGRRTSRNVLPVRFVPMTGKIQKQQ